MMMRRSITHVLVSLVLLLSQQMALSHMVAHWGGRVAAAELSQKAELPASKGVAQDQWCDQCLAFAQIAGAVGSTVRSFVPFNPGADAIPAFAAHLHCARTVCAFRSRAPPVTV